MIGNFLLMCFLSRITQYSYFEHIFPYYASCFSLCFRSHRSCRVHKYVLLLQNAFSPLCLFVFICNQGLMGRKTNQTVLFFLIIELQRVIFGQKCPRCYVITQNNTAQVILNLGILLKHMSFTCHQALMTEQQMATTSLSHLIFPDKLALSFHEH